MKKITIYLLFLFFVFSGAKVFSQVCTGHVELVPIGNCCFEVQLVFTGACAGIQINQVELNSNAFSNVSGDIVSAFSYQQYISASVNSGQDLATFNSSQNLIDPNTIGQFIPIGEICLANPVHASGIITLEVNLNGPNFSCPNPGFNCPGPIETPVPCVVSPPVPFGKLYGNPANNRPRVVKAFGDGVYVAGMIEDAGLLYTTFSKFDIGSGNLIWDVQFQMPSVISDFEYIPSLDEFILVGRTDPIVSMGNIVDTRSVITKIDDQGNCKGTKIYNHTGRERFSKIIRHPSPGNSFPYYLLGQISPSLNSAFCIPILYNIDQNLTVNWARRYDYFEMGNPVELEVARGLVSLSNGNLLLLGNGRVTNEGVLAEVSGATGNFIQGQFYPGVIDWYDGVELSSGEIALSGTDFGSSRALIYVVSANNYSHVTNLRFNDVLDFKEIGLDANGDLYALGRKTGAAPNFHVMARLNYSPTGVLSRSYSRYLFDNETLFEEPHFSVTPSHNNIFYADGRSDNSSGFGDFDMLVGSFDLSFTGNCIEDFPPNESLHPVPTIPFQMDDDAFPEPPFDPDLICLFLDYDCNDFCVPCTADIISTTDCCSGQFTGQVSGGTGPYTWEWDVNCDGTIDGTGQNFNWNFPTCGTYDVCLKVTDAFGKVCSAKETVDIKDGNPPMLDCQGITVSTDPGVCYATLNLPVMVTDDCDPNPMLACVVSGVTTGDETTTMFNKGVTTVTCVATDKCGNATDCGFTITVVDMEPPQITCPSSYFGSVPVCNGGQIVNFSAGPPTDNCPMVTDVYSHQSGDFFPCGTTIVTRTATDMSGLTASCSFPITVNCRCGEISGSSISCGVQDETYDFCIMLDNLTGAPNSDCTVGVTTAQSGVTVDQGSLTVTWSGAQATVCGTIITAPPPVPTSISLSVSLNCNCPNGGPVNCTLPINLTTPCCEEVSIDNMDVCKNASTVSVPLVNCNNLYDVQQVRWYIADAPCPPSSWGPPFQVTTGCNPLILEPIYHTGDICVFAEVFSGSDDGPCQMLTSNVAAITLCEPVGCSLNGQEHCYSGTPITPAPLTINLNPSNPNCSYDIQWYDENGILIPGAINPTYQPPALSFTGNPNDCFQDYVYTAEITSKCGVQSCSAAIRLYNDDAPVGTLVLDPVETLPLCYGEDASLRYTPECAGDPERWDWFYSISYPTFMPLTTNGDRNPVYNTNRLYQDTWYRVEKQNGVCPVDEIEILIDITDPLTITNFSAQYDPPCAPTGVIMQVDFMPDYSVLGSSCDYTIFWYRNGDIIHTSVQNSSPAVYTYSGPGFDLGGNYYVVIQDNCCPGQRRKSPVVSLDPPTQIVVAGPCFRCKTEQFQMEGIVLFPPTVGCTYQWYDENGFIPGETGTIITIDPSQKGPIVFEATCGGCIYTASFDIKQCGENPLGILDFTNSIDAKLFPNPTSGELYIEFSESLKTETVLQIFDVNGKLMRSQDLDSGISKHFFKVSEFTGGTYYIKILQNDIPVWVQAFIKH